MDFEFQSFDLSTTYSNLKEVLDAAVEYEIVWYLKNYWTYKVIKRILFA